MPRLNGSRTTRAPAAAATAAVSSVDPSSITSTSQPGASRCSAPTTLPTVAASLYAGTTASRRSSFGMGMETRTESRALSLRCNSACGSQSSSAIRGAARSNTR